MWDAARDPGEPPFAQPHIDEIESAEARRVALGLPTLEEWLDSRGVERADDTVLLRCSCGQSERVWFAVVPARGVLTCDSCGCRWGVTARGRAMWPLTWSRRASHAGPVTERAAYPPAGNSKGRLSWFEWVIVIVALAPALWAVYALLMVCLSLEAPAD